MRALLLMLTLCLPGLVAAVPAEPPFRLLMVLWRGETEAEQGFVEALNEAAFPIHIDRIDAGQDREQLAAHFWQLRARALDYDAVYSFGTTASVMTQSIVRGRLPQLYTMVSDPVEAGLVSVPGSAPIFGVTDAIAADLKLTTARQLFPIRHIAMLFNARERNARVQLEEMTALCTRLDIELTVLRVAPDSSSLTSHLQRLAEQPGTIDTVYLPSDSYIISQSATIMKALADTDYRVIGATETFVQDGALLAIAPDYRALGQQLARRLIELHRHGALLDPEPIRVEQPQVLYNEATRARLGIEIPEGLRAQMTPVRAPAVSR